MANRKSYSHLLILLFSLLMLSSCQPTPAPDSIKETYVTFGTLVEVELYAVTKEQAEPLLDTIRKDLDYFNFSLHAWKPGSLGRVNQMMSAASEFSANPSVIPLLAQAKTLSLQSNELFNPAIGNLIDLWGFHSDQLPTGPPPSVAAIQHLLAQKPSMRDFEIKGVRINNKNAAVRFDLGAIAKGYAVEKIAAYLRQQGVKHALLSAAGDIKALGQHGARPWFIGIRHPRQPGVIASTLLQDNEAISTSGDYERFYEHNGKRYHHIFDPRTGYPADHSISVTVIHTDAATADAAATALFVAGPREWSAIAKAMNINFVMLLDKNGQIHLSRAMADRLKFEIQPTPPLTIVELQ
jgi:thiamine biosynthesis lipoprotein